VNDCESGNTVTGLCPGPASFKCCLPKPGLKPNKPGQPTKPANPSSNCPASRVNAGTIGMVKQFEGFVPSVYNDPIGLPTVGYGHLCKQPKCAEVPFPIPLSEAHATNLLRSDIRTAEECVSSAINDSVTLNENQYGALVSWAFNVGCGNVRSSGLVRRLNAGEHPSLVVLQEMPKWRNAGGKPMSGLVLRRGREVAFFQVPSSVIAHPPSCSAPSRRR
jgi:GH24 family phage-related lysozyme (muramidase)